MEKNYSIDNCINDFLKSELTNRWLELSENE